MKTVLCAFSLVIYIIFPVHDASIDIVAGWYHNCAFGPDGLGLKCWGENNRGQLGYGDTNNRGDGAGEMGANLPIVALGTDFVVFGATSGEDHSCAISQEQTMRCWGSGSRYKLGHATYVDVGDSAGEMGDNLAFVEFRVDFLPFKLALGDEHSCVLSTDSSLVCFGLNGVGQCGSGTSDFEVIGPPTNIPAVDLGSNFTPIDISAFYRHTCAVSQQQTVKCFGINDDGQLGYGDLTDRGKTADSMGDGLPTINLGSNFTPNAVAVGRQHTCVLSTVKTLKCFGNNYFGQCGRAFAGDIGDAANEMGDNLPIVNFGAGFVPKEMALGEYFTCILSESAQVVCFGANNFGQLGLGNTAATDRSGYTFTPIDLGTDFVPRKIVAGAGHACAISTMDTMKCWGWNAYGQLGLGHANNAGDEPNEMGDNLPLVNVCSVCTDSPTQAPSSQPSASPTTTAPAESPTTASPTALTSTLSTTDAMSTTAALLEAEIREEETVTQVTQDPEHHDAIESGADRLHWVVSVGLCIGGVCLCFALLAIAKCATAKRRRHRNRGEIMMQAEPGVAREVEIAALQSQVVPNLVALISDPKVVEEKADDDLSGDADFEHEGEALRASVVAQPGISTLGCLQADEFEVIGDNQTTGGNYSANYVHTKPTANGLLDDEFEVVDDNKAAMNNTRGE